MSKKNGRITVFISVDREVVQIADDIAAKTGLKRSRILASAAEAGWPIVVKRWQRILKGGMLKCA